MKSKLGFDKQRFEDIVKCTCELSAQMKYGEARGLTSLWGFKRGLAVGL